MNKRTRIAAGAAALVTVATGGAWVALGSASASSDLRWPSTSMSEAETLASARAEADGDSEILVLRERVQRERFVDVGRSGESPGDYLLFENRLLNRSGEQVGRDSVLCLLGIRTFSCEATAIIPDRGKLRVGGVFFGNNDNKIPILGGTREFKEAGGQMSLTEAPNGDELLVFEIVQ